MKTVVRDIPCREHVAISPEVAVAANCSRDDDKADMAGARDFCCCAETSNNLNLQSFDSDCSESS